MRGQFRALVVAGVTLAAGLGTITSASAATTPLTIETSMYSCTGGVCSMGLGNVGMTFESDPVATGGPEYSGPESSPYVWTVVSGSLPAGLPSETYGSLATYAAEAGVPVVLDAGGTALWQGVSRRPALASLRQPANLT